MEIENYMLIYGWVFVFKTTLIKHAYCLQIAIWRKFPGNQTKHNLAFLDKGGEPEEEELQLAGRHLRIVSILVSFCLIMG